VHVERPSDVSNRLAFRDQLRCNLRLISVEFARSAEAHTALPRGFTPGSGPLAD
jgi:hypothetical protein